MTVILDITNFRGEVWDLDTGLKVPKVYRLDVDAGILEAFKVDERGCVMRDALGRALVYKARGRFTAVPKTVTKRAKLLEAASNCVRCGSKLTLPGEERCVRCRADDEGNRLKSFRLDDDPFDPHRCECCSRQAIWCVADEVEVSHEVIRQSINVPGTDRTINGKVGYERGTTVGRRYYCERHHKPPRLLDADGEVIKDLEERR